MQISPARPAEDAAPATAAEQAARSPLLRALVATYLSPPRRSDSAPPVEKPG